MYGTKRIEIELIAGIMIVISAACSASETPPIMSSASIPSTSEIQTATSPTQISTQIDVSGPPLSTQTSLPPQAPFGIELQPGYNIEHILRPVLLMPCDVQVSPNGRIFFVEWEGYRVLELGEDGTSSTFLELEKPVESILFNSVGDLFIMQGDELLKISPIGERSVFAQINSPGGWAFDSQDNLFMIVGGELLRFSPNGEKSVIVRGVENGDMAISSTGDIYIASGAKGQIFKVTLDGSISSLASGFVYDAFNIALDPQGHLYQNQLYFTQVSLEDGSLSDPILRDYSALLLSRPFTFTPSGDAIFIGPTSNNAFKASIQNGTVSVLVAGIGNSHALAVDASGNVFIGASNEFPLLPGRIIKIRPDGSTIEYATGFFRIRDLVLDDVGNMFVSDIDQEGGGGGRLIKIEADGRRSIMLTGHYDLRSMVYDPVTTDILAFEQHRHELIKLTQGGTVQSIPIDFGGETETIDLASDNSGEFIALVTFLENYNIGPVHRGLYRLSSEYQPTLIIDIDTPLATSEDDVFVAPSGDIFVVGPEKHPEFRMLRISPQGEVNVVARKLPYDTLSLTISNSGDIYFSCSAGLFRISQVE